MLMYLRIVLLCTPMFKLTASEARAILIRAGREVCQSVADARLAFALTLSYASFLRVTNKIGD